MPQHYEIANFDSHTPFRCVVHHIGHIKPHMHDYFEILFVLSGTCNIIIDNQLSQLTDGDIIIVESHIIHELRASDCVYASVQLDQTSLENNFPDPFHPKFACNSTIPGKEAAYDRLRHEIALLIQNNADKPNGYELQNWILIYRLMYTLYTYFRVDRSAALERRNHRYAERIAEISGIIREHYTEDLPLSMIADMVHLSVPYLSKFFMEQFGMNYLTYLTQLRVNHAVHELENTEKNIEEISADSGFPNSHAFTQAFKKEYGMMPSAYRRRQAAQKKEGKMPSIEHSDYLANLRNYLSPDTDRSEKDLPSLSASGEFSAINGKKELRHTWKQVLSVGKAADILLYDIQIVLRRVKTEIGFSYLFFNGILSDELHVCQPGKDGGFIYHFAYVDRILDFLMEIDLLPFISFSYMPTVLARQSDKLLFQHLVSEPADIRDWQKLIQAFMEHVISRYGIAAVQKWKFCVWHQPNTTARLYGFEEDSDFYTFYKITQNTVKGLVPLSSFGFPAMFRNAEGSLENWYLDMLKWCKDNDCMPDFLNFTYYDTKLVKEKNHSRSAFGFVFTMTLNDQPDGLSTFINCIKSDGQNYEISHLPVYLSEWNNTPSQQDLLNDTCFKSCYLVKNILDNYDRLDCFSYWSLSDLMSEAPFPDRLLFGGVGLFTKNGLPKASYFALKLMGQLGDCFLGSGKGWFATRTEQDIRIITYHYVHLSSLYASGEKFIMTSEDRYTMFRSVQPLTLSLNIRNMEESTYTVKEYLVGRKSGSLYDAWVDTGCIDPSNLSDLELLKAQSMPSMHQSVIEAAENTLLLHIQMEPLDVKLIIVR